MEISSDYEWRFETSKRPGGYDEAFLKSIHEVYLDGFGKTEGWSLKGINAVLLSSSIRGFLRNKDEIAGYAFYTVPTETLNGSYMLWEDAICLKKSAQARRFTQGIIEKVMGLFSNKNFGWIGGRTQNPLVVKRYSDLGQVFPFNALYDTEDGKQIMDFVLKHIPQARTFSGKAAFVDKITGICRNAYADGRLGDYSTEVPGAEAFERQLLEWGFNRDNGDAVLVVSRLSGITQRPSDHRHGSFVRTDWIPPRK